MLEDALDAFPDDLADEVLVEPDDVLDELLDEVSGAEAEGLLDPVSEFVLVVEPPPELLADDPFDDPFDVPVKYLLITCQVSGPTTPSTLKP